MNCRELKYKNLHLTDPELVELGRNPFTRHIALEAAMCAWEARIEAKGDESWEGGAAQERMCCGSLAEAIHIGYCIANVDDACDGIAYDWEFVPWFVATCVVWESTAAYSNGYPDLKVNWIDLCRKFNDPVPELTADEELLKECFLTLDLSFHNVLAVKLDKRLKRDAA